MKLKKFIKKVKVIGEAKVKFGNTDIGVIKGGSFFDTIKGCKDHLEYIDYPIDCIYGTGDALTNIVVQLAPITENKEEDSQKTQKKKIKKMRSNRNLDLIDYASDKGVPMYKIATKYGIAPSTLSYRISSKEFDGNEKRRFRNIVDKIAKNNKN